MNDIYCCLKIIGIERIPEISEDHNIAHEIIDATKKQKLTIEDGDILVIAQKIISKNEGKKVKSRSIACVFAKSNDSLKSFPYSISSAPNAFIAEFFSQLFPCGTTTTEAIQKARAAKATDCP